jgi:pimeloyl-ACP methyl ester carboxylesterase
MNPVSVPTQSRLGVAYTLHRAAEPKGDRLIVLHHGICHTREQFLPLIAQLNRLGIDAAMIDQQSEHAGRFRNCLGVKPYREGMAAAVKMMEAQEGRIGSYALHSMGALIGEEMQQQYPEFRRPTVLMAPIPVEGALPITLRILRRQPLSYLKAVATLNIHSLAKTPEQVRELFFDAETPEGIVQRTAAQLKHAPFWIYCQLVLRRIVRPKIQNDGSPKMLLYSKTDEIFHPGEYKTTPDRYPQLEQRLILGGHDFFIEHAEAAAERIAAFHAQHAPSGRDLRQHAAEGELHPHFSHRPVNSAESKGKSDVER